MSATSIHFNLNVDTSESDEFSIIANSIKDLEYLHEMKRLESPEYAKRADNFHIVSISGYPSFLPFLLFPLSSLSFSFLSTFPYSLSFLFLSSFLLSFLSFLLSVFTFSPSLGSPSPPLFLPFPSLFTFSPFSPLFLPVAFFLASFSYLFLLSPHSLPCFFLYFVRYSFLSLDFLVPSHIVYLLPFGFPTSTSHSLSFKFSCIFSSNKILMDGDGDGCVNKAGDIKLVQERE